MSRYTYTNDQRFRAIHKLRSEDYLLHILPVKVRYRVHSKTAEYIHLTLCVFLCILEDKLASGLQAKVRATS